jgi:hypothetical protein
MALKMKLSEWFAGSIEYIIEIDFFVISIDIFYE